jgi:hypothetical protein
VQASEYVTSSRDERHESSRRDRRNRNDAHTFAKLLNGNHFEVILLFFPYLSIFTILWVYLLS